MKIIKSKIKVDDLPKDVWCNFYIEREGDIIREVIEYEERCQ